MSAEELTTLIHQSQAGDMDAYGRIVRRFQDMAVGYARSILGDSHLAEDAAQEAFVQAYRDLAMLSAPRAFPGWLKRIVFKHCDRLTRRKGVSVVGLSDRPPPAETAPDAGAEALRQEMVERVRTAVATLPSRERAVATLHYFDGHSRRTIAEFLELPLTTVNNRLHAARQRLREKMARDVTGEEIAKRVAENMDAAES